jgi:methylmalonyl-CoA mutase cobalamin-binding subunit
MALPVEEDGDVTGLPQRDEILPEPRLPSSADLIARGRARAAAVELGSCPFLSRAQVTSEAAYKRGRMGEGRLMLHAQIGYRDPATSRRAWREIHDRVAEAGGNVDRYGICLDWSMGYPAAERRGRAKGTGLVLPDAASWAALSAEAPVAPHFGDFVLGMPAAVENCLAALGAGATTIGNLGQYFTFRLPGWSDDLATTAATVEALALLAAHPSEIVVHSNLDDGFAALFCDLASAYGAALIEAHIVEDLLGGSIAHCYGHSFSNPLTRVAFQRALASREGAPGSMIYGNTVAYRGTGAENYAALARYLAADALAQIDCPSGHALNPVPISEAERIPDIDEVVAAQLFALRLFERIEEQRELFSTEEAERLAQHIIAGGTLFRDRVLAGMEGAGIDTADAVELLLVLRRIGAKRLEELFGPGDPAPAEPRGRRPLVKASTLDELEREALRIVGAVRREDRERITRADLSVCLASTDVHEYGKILAEALCRHLEVRVIDAGVHAEPDAVAGLALDGSADLLAVSTYNGIALDYLVALRDAVTERGGEIPIVIGGRLNQIAENSNSSLPRDVTAALAEAGGLPCPDMASFTARLVETAKAKERA